MWLPRCQCVYESLPVNFWMPETIFIKFGMYVYCDVYGGTRH
jgi:hypothetical protein